MLLRDAAQFPLAQKFREGSATLSEVYAFISGLYFRGKAAYSAAFAAPPAGAPAAMVITPGRGLVHPDTPLTHDEFRAIAASPVEDAGFADMLRRDAALLHSQAGGDCTFVLLGSIATDKYTRALLDVFNDRLLFPSEFVGRGDMSRGGLMLRAASAGVELAYVPVAGAVLRGVRPPRLPRKR